MINDMLRQLSQEFKQHYKRVISVYAEKNGIYSITDSKDSSESELKEIQAYSEPGVTFHIGVMNGKPYFEMDSSILFEIESGDPDSIDWDEDLILVFNGNRYWICFRDYR